MNKGFLSWSGLLLAGLSDFATLTDLATPNNATTEVFNLNSLRKKTAYATNLIAAWSPGVQVVGISMPTYWPALM